MFEIHASAASTMDIARENVAAGRVLFDAEGGPDCYGVLARTQTAGRGQRGRTWQDIPGESLCATFYLLLPTPERAGEMAFVAGAAVAMALDETMARVPPPEPRPIIGLKWPNDILLNEKKTGGILIETASGPDGQTVALIGLGLNVTTQNFPPELAESATSLLREGMTGKTPEAWAETIYAEIQQIASLLQFQGFAAVLGLWRMYDATPGRRYETEINNEIVQGVAEDVYHTGALVLALDDGRTVAVSSASHLSEL